MVTFKPSKLGCSFHNAVKDSIEAIGKLQPILALADRDSETGNVISKYPLGIIANSNNTMNIRDRLKNFTTLISSKGKVINDANLYARKFSFDSMLRKIKVEIMDH